MTIIGLGGSGAVLYYRSTEVWHGSYFLGDTAVTNNQAEYYGLINGLKEIVNLKIRKVHLKGDSLLIINQVLGNYKVKNEKLKIYYEEAMQLIGKIPEVSFSHV